MRRTFVETDDTGTVVEIHVAEVRGNKGRDAKEPRNAIKTKKVTHKVRLSNAANKGDKWSEKHGCFLRPLTRTDEQRERMESKLRAKRERGTRRAVEKGATIKTRPGKDT
jgi:hypothetical protein